MEKRSHKALLGKKTFERLLTTDFYVMRDLMTFFYAQLLFRFLCGDIWTLLKLTAIGVSETPYFKGEKMYKTSETPSGKSLQAYLSRFLVATILFRVDWWNLKRK